MPKFSTSGLATAIKLHIAVERSSGSISSLSNTEVHDERTYLQTNLEVLLPLCITGCNRLNIKFIWNIRDSDFDDRAGLVIERQRLLSGELIATAYGHKQPGAT